MKRIYLIDCPGVVYPSVKDTETDIVLRGVVRVENLSTPEDHISALLEKVKPDYIKKTYALAGWTDGIDFLTQMAKKTGKLLRGGEPDLSSVAKMVLNDWLRGKIPYFNAPEWTGEEMKGQTELPTVSQVFKSIRVTTNFAKEDLVDVDGVVPGGKSAGEVTEGEEGDNTEAGVESELEWDDVYGESSTKDASLIAEEGEDEAKIPAETAILGALSDSEYDSDASDVDDGDKSIGSISTMREEDDDEESKQKKGKRVTTNKGKVGVHYYETANVKNRNRKRVKPKELTGDKKNERKQRKH